MTKKFKEPIQSTEPTRRTDRDVRSERARGGGEVENTSIKVSQSLNVSFKGTPPRVC